MMACMDFAHLWIMPIAFTKVVFSIFFIITCYNLETCETFALVIFKFIEHYNQLCSYTCHKGIEFGNTLNPPWLAMCVYGTKTI
jgi:hypothetical protein